VQCLQTVESCRAALALTRYGFRRHVTVGDSDADGKPARFRYTETHLSPERYTYRADVAVGGAKWTELAKGEIMRVK
jgi:hypothetical protein